MTLDDLRHASAENAVFDSHQNVFDFPIALIGLSGLKGSPALKGWIRGAEPVDRLLLVREDLARVGRD